MYVTHCMTARLERVAAAGALSLRLRVMYCMHVMSCMYVTHCMTAGLERVAAAGALSLRLRVMYCMHVM